MDTKKNLRNRGYFLLGTFFLILITIFMPIFPGNSGVSVNGLDYLDNFFNELSKSSAYHIDSLKKENASLSDKAISYALKMKSFDEAEIATTLFTANQITAQQIEKEIIVKGNFSAIMSSILNDSDAMYQNNNQQMQQKYGIDGRQVLYTWNSISKEMANQLQKEKAFLEAKFVENTISKAIEPAYNYFNIEAKPVKQGIILLIGSLFFYVLYTVWYGFGLLYIFEGIGIKLEH